MHDFIVYALCDPRTHQIRYIGASSQGLVRPLSYRNYGHNPELSAWLRDMVACHLEYVILVLATAPSLEKLHELEAHWIATGVFFGWPLTNISQVPRTPSKDVLMPPGKAWSIKSWRRDPEVKAALRASVVGRRKKK